MITIRSRDRYEQRLQDSSDRAEEDNRGQPNTNAKTNAFLGHTKKYPAFSTNPIPVIKPVLG